MEGYSRTKIVCTLGPASSSMSKIQELMRAGMDVARLNFSHGNHDSHKRLISNIRKSAKKTGKIIAILQDLQGPKIRLGNIGEDGIDLKKGQKITFFSGKKGAKTDIPVTYNNLHKDLKTSHRLFIDDGMVEVNVKQIKGRKIHGIVVNGGLVKTNDGVNLPDSKISAPAFTKKDKEDLLFGLSQHVDWIALSFVTSAATVRNVRKIIQGECRRLGIPQVKIFVKIERKQAIENFLEILEETDGVLLARGDLGIEIPPEEVPIIQKEFTEICRANGKPIIIATQMMNSMQGNPRATRAETSDVANAVFDHADCVMLSGETASGKYPVKAVRAMQAVIGEAEASRMDDIAFYQIHDITSAESALAQSIHIMAENDQINFVVTAASFGRIAQLINMFRPNVPILVAVDDKQAARQMIVRAGVYPFIMSDNPGTFIHRAKAHLQKQSILSSKKRVAYIVATASGRLELTIE